MSNVEAIKKALEGVTPGRWEVYSEKVADKAAAIAESAYQVEHTDPFVGEVFMLNAGGKCPALTGCGPCSEANARYIAAVNPATISELLTTLEALQRENEDLLAENGELRNIVSNCAAALMTSAFVSPKCSIDFMKGVPKEISSTVGKLRALASAGEEHHEL